MGEFSIKELEKIISSGDFDSLIGKIENDFFDCKRQIYHLENEYSKRELAKDVSSFVNLNGGYILIGPKTDDIKTHFGDEVTEISLFRQDLVDPNQYKNVIKDWIYPDEIQGIRVYWKASKDNANKGIVVIKIPTQKESQKPFLISKIVEEEKKISETIFGYAERSGDRSNPNKIKDIYKIMRDGLLFDKKIEARFDNIEFLIANQRKAKKEKQIKVLDNWFSSNKATAFKSLRDLGIKTFMEVEIRIQSLNLNIAKKILKESARKSTIRTFGWPIGVFFDNRPEFVPKVDLNGIHAEISIKEKDWMDQKKERITYDYWAIHSNGAFYLLKSLFEDARKPNQIFFNTRIVRITEIFMYIQNLYSFFKIPSNAEIKVMIKHGGLKGRILSSSSGRSLFKDYKTDSDEVLTTIKITLDEIESGLVSIIEQFTNPLFEQFEFFELERKVLENIVVNYLNGKVV